MVAHASAGAPSGWPIAAAKRFADKNSTKRSMSVVQ